MTQPMTFINAPDGALFSSSVPEVLEPLAHGYYLPVRRQDRITSQVFAHPPNRLTADVSLETSNAAFAEVEDDAASVVIDFLSKSLEPIDHQWGNTALLRPHIRVIGVHHLMSPLVFGIFCDNSSSSAPKSSSNALSPGCAGTRLSGR